MNILTDDGLALIKIFEGLKLKAYQDGGGIWTCGYGHTKDVNSNTTCTPAKADEWLNEDVQNAEREVSDHINVPLNNNQFSALVSLVYNVGDAPLMKHLGAYLNAGEYEQAADEFLKWNHVDGQVSQGLTRRRTAERKLFLTPIVISITSKQGSST